MERWPANPDELVAEQLRLAAETPPPWVVTPGSRIGGCFVCFPRGEHGRGRPGDRAWAAAVLAGDVAVAGGDAAAAYEAGLLALREGLLLERAVRSLPRAPDVLLVNATGRDHPRRAGLALHLGAVLGMPTVGVTHRPLLARGEWPPDERGAWSPLLLEGERVGCWLRTRPGTRPLAVHAAWRTGPVDAVAIVLAATRSARTPEPIRVARRAARAARAASRSRQACENDVVAGTAVVELSSTAFADGGPIPVRHTCEGADVSPPLTWGELPAGTASLAIQVDDPDAPGGTFTHWLAWGIDPAVRALTEGATPAAEGRNGFGGRGYRGPCPPRGDGPHRYVFRVFALDAPLALDRGANEHAFRAGLAGHVVGTGVLTGTYERR